MRSSHLYPDRARLLMAVANLYLDLLQKTGARDEIVKFHKVVTRTGYYRMTVGEKPPLYDFFPKSLTIAAAIFHWLEISYHQDITRLIDQYYAGVEVVDISEFWKYARESQEPLVATAWAAFRLFSDLFEQDTQPDAKPAGTESKALVPPSRLGKTLAEALPMLSYDILNIASGYLDSVTVIQKGRKGLFVSRNILGQQPKPLREFLNARTWAMSFEMATFLFGQWLANQTKIALDMHYYVDRQKFLMAIAKTATQLAWRISRDPWDEIYLPNKYSYAVHPSIVKFHDFLLKEGGMIREVGHPRIQNIFGNIDDWQVYLPAGADIAKLGCTDEGKGPHEISFDTLFTIGIHAWLEHEASKDRIPLEGYSRYRARSFQGMLKENYDHLGCCFRPIDYKTLQESLRDDEVGARLFLPALEIAAGRAKG